MAEATWSQYAIYNIGWNGGWKSYRSFYGSPAFGKDYYGNHRCMMFRIQTETLNAGKKYKLIVKMPICRSSYAGSGTDVWHYAVALNMDSIVGTGGGSTPWTTPSDAGISLLLSGTLDVYAPSQNSGYFRQTIELPESTVFESNTEYCVLFYSDTPYAWHNNYYMGFLANHSSYGGLITFSFEEGSSSTTQPVSNFKWDSIKTDDSWILSASEWNRFCTELKRKTKVTIPSGYQTGDYLTTEQFNEIVKILNLNYRIFHAKDFQGHYFNDLVDALNNLPEPVSEEEE